MSRVLLYFIHFCHFVCLVVNEFLWTLFKYPGFFMFVVRKKGFFVKGFKIKLLMSRFLKKDVFLGNVTEIN